VLTESELGFDRQVAAALGANFLSAERGMTDERSGPVSRIVDARGVDCNRAIRLVRWIAFRLAIRGCGPAALSSNWREPSHSLWIGGFQCQSLVNAAGLRRPRGRTARNRGRLPARTLWRVECEPNRPLSLSKRGMGFHVSGGKKKGGARHATYSESRAPRLRLYRPRKARNCWGLQVTPADVHNIVYVCTNVS
jgi:hypothetical protein